MRWLSLNILPDPDGVSHYSHEEGYKIERFGAGFITRSDNDGLSYWTPDARVVRARFETEKTQEETP